MPGNRLRRGELKLDDAKPGPIRKLNPALVLITLGSISSRRWFHLIHAHQDNGFRRLHRCYLVEVTTGLEFVFEIRARVGAPIVVGDTGRGTRRIVPIESGEFEGSGMHGILLAGGADYQLIHPDGFTEIEARYVLETDRGARIYAVNRGMRHSPREVIERLNAGENVDPSAVYFRATPVFETAAPELAWLMRSIFVSSGERSPDAVRIRVYRVP